MRRGRWVLVFLFFLFIYITPLAFADSPYVLPYPSVMPGNKLYTIHVLWEKLLRYWYFGNFGQFNYNLQESDKYLVEARTLLEYKQYLLASKALSKSDTYFSKVKPFLIAARKEGKNITQNSIILQEASEKHREVLEKMEQDTPESITWNPEKSQPTIINFHDIFENSIHIRKIGVL